jgi:hypothetical protein
LHHCEMITDATLRALTPNVSVFRVSNMCAFRLYIM